MLFREAYAQHVTSGGNASALKGQGKNKNTGNTNNNSNSDKGLYALKGLGKKK